MHVAVYDRAGDHRLETLSGILAYCDAAVETVDPILVEWIHSNVSIVERPRVDPTRIVHRTPTLASVVRTQQRALLGLDEGIHDVGIVLGNRDTGSTEFALGKTVLFGVPLPVLARVVRDIQTTTGSARCEEPRPTTMLPHGNE